MTRETVMLPTPARRATSWTVDPIVAPVISIPNGEKPGQPRKARERNDALRQTAEHKANTKNAPGPGPASYEALAWPPRQPRHEQSDRGTGRGTKWRTSCLRRVVPSRHADSRAGGCPVSLRTRRA